MSRSASLDKSALQYNRNIVDRTKIWTEVHYAQFSIPVRPKDGVGHFALKNGERAVQYKWKESGVVKLNRFDDSFPCVARQANIELQLLYSFRVFLTFSRCC